MIPYSLFLLLDRSAGVDGKIEQVKAEAQGEFKPRISIVRVLRLVSGGATVASGFVTLFVLAMIFRPLYAANAGGVFTVIGFFAAAFALGGVLTAMWLGHWYLVTPALSGRPLQFATTLVLVAVLVQVALSFLIGPSTAYVNKPLAPTGHTTISAVPTPSASGSHVKPVGAPVITPLGTDAINWLHILVAFAIPLLLGGLAWKLIRDRSFQSATGMLYLVVVCTLAGEVLARGLFLLGL